MTYIRCYIITQRYINPTRVRETKAITDASISFLYLGVKRLLPSLLYIVLTTQYSKLMQCFNMRFMCLSLL